MESLSIQRWLAVIIFLICTSAFADDTNDPFQEIVAKYRAANPKPRLSEEAHKFKVQAELAVQENQFDKAVELYGKALRIAPWWPTGHFDRAVIMGETKEYWDAIREMKRYLLLVPDAPDAHAAQDQIYQWEGLADEVLVNGNGIPRARIDLRVKAATAQGQQDSPELRKAVREDMINLEVTAQEAVKTGLDKNPDVIPQTALADQSVLVSAFVQAYLKKYLQEYNKEEQQKEIERVITTLRANFTGGADSIFIPQARVDLRVKIAASQGQADTPELRKAIREDMIRLEVLAQEGKKIGLDKDPGVIQQTALADQSVLVSALVKDYLKNHPISDDQLKQEYERTSNLGNKEYNARHILVKTEAEAREIIDQLGKNGDFEKLAKEKSKDAGSAEHGGSLGWAAPNNFVSPFSNALTKLKKDEYTKDPVETQFGWHVIKLDDD